MHPGPVLRREPVLQGVDGAAPPPELLSVFFDRADLDAYAAGGDALLIQFGAVGGAAYPFYLQAVTFAIWSLKWDILI